MDIREREAKTEARKKLAFDKWLDGPMVRMGVSMIPAGDHQDTLRLLLQDAFSAGFVSGGSDIILDMLDGFVKSLPQQRPRE